MEVDFSVTTNEAEKKFIYFFQLIGKDWVDSEEKLSNLRIEIEFFKIPGLIKKYSDVLTPGISNVFESGFEFYLCNGKVEETVFCPISNIKRFGDLDNKRLISKIKGYDKIT